MNDDTTKKVSDKPAQRKASCYCQGKHGLFLHNRQLSWIVSSALLLNFFIFIGGYFFGQRRSVEYFTCKIEQDSFADHIYSSLCSMNDCAMEIGEHDDSDDIAYSAGTIRRSKQDEGFNDQENAGNVNLAVTRLAPELSQHKADDNLLVKKSADLEHIDTQETVNEYYAQLIGFGTAKAAQRFAERLQRKDIPVFVKNRRSRTAKGRIVRWYQVVTEKFSSKAELLALVQMLESREKLKDVHIVSC